MWKFFAKHTNIHVCKWNLNIHIYDEWKEFAVTCYQSIQYSSKKVHTFTSAWWHYFLLPEFES